MTIAVQLVHTAGTVVTVKLQGTYSDCSQMTSCKFVAASTWYSYTVALKSEQDD